MNSQIPDEIPLLSFYEHCKLMYFHAQYLTNYTKQDQEHVAKNPEHFVVIPGHIFKDWESAYLKQRAKVIAFKGEE